LLHVTYNLLVFMYYLLLMHVIAVDINGVQIFCQPCKLNAVVLGTILHL